MSLSITSALIACFLTFTSFLWFVNDTQTVGMVFAAGCVIGSYSSVELVSENAPRYKDLIYWIGISVFNAFLNFGAALFFVKIEGYTLVAAAIAGFFLGPTFAVAYESASELTKAQGVTEAMSSGLINTVACTVSAI